MSTNIIKHPSSSTGRVKFYGWLVVRFEEEDTISIIPSNWIKNKHEAYWPPGINTRKLVQERADINTNWSIHTISIITVDETYLGALKKEKKYANNESLITTDEETLGRGSRKRKIRRLTDAESSDEEPIELEKHRSRIPDKTPIPTRKIRRLTDAESSDEEPIELEKHRSRIPDKTPIPTPVSLSRLQTPTVEPGHITANQAAAILKGLATVQVGLQRLETEMVLNRSVMKSLKESKNSRDQCVITLPDEIKFPIKNYEDFVTVNTQMENTDIMKAVVEKLSRIGGLNTKNATRRVMEFILTHELSLGFNWTGRSSYKTVEGKKAFAGTKICESVITSVMKIVNTNQKDIEHEIMVWLRGAIDRNGGRKKRMRQERQEE